MNRLANYYFPDSYYNNLVANATTVKYVSASGSDSNNGNTVTTPYLTIGQALSATSATATTVTIVVLEGTYDITASYTTTYGAACITDGNNPRVFVCCPGKVIINCTDTSGKRDFAPIDFRNSSSGIYGAIINRNNGARTNAYSVSIFNDETLTFKGAAYNTVYREINANNNWAIQYDNSNDSTAKAYNCTFYNGAGSLSDYSGSTGCVLTSCVFNTALTTSATKTSCLTSQTVNSTTYVTSGVTTAGVYSGTYAWNGAITTGITSIVATGGTVETIVSGGMALKKHTFTTSGSFVVSSFGAGDTFDYIVVGGGGGGTYNNYVGSGGGGAAVNYGNTNAASTTYTVTIGSGGAGKTGGYGGGGNGTATTLTGGVVSVTSGGGPGSGMNGNPDATGTYTYGAGDSYRGAGAGGAGQAGQGSNGGNGKLITSGVFDTNTTYYGGGGAGGLASASGLTVLYGGLGGGANTTLSGGQLATLNSGGGGAGGSAAQGTPSSSGAAGVVVIAYYTTNPDGIYASANSIVSGANVTFTLYSATTGNVPYTITGVTSGIINNASLTGNFVMSGGTGQITVIASTGLTASYTLTMSAETYSANVTLGPNVSISTSIIEVPGSNVSAYLENPVAGQMEIPKSVTTELNYSVSSTPLVSTANRVNPVSLSYTTMTNSIAGPIEAGVIKVFGDIPQREYWM